MNHDGREDIVAEVRDNKDNLKILVIPQLVSGISPQHYTYTNGSNFYYNGLNENRWLVTDWNCDGYNEVILRNEYCTNVVSMIDTKYDTTFSNLRNFNLSQRIGFVPKDKLYYSIYDWDGDNKLDVVVQTIKQWATNSTYLLCKNISINDQTSLTLINRNRDTLPALIDGECEELVPKKYSNQILYKDTTYNFVESEVYDPITKKLIPIWIRVNTFNIYYRELLSTTFSVYEDSLFLISGIVCGKSLNDTLRRRGFQYNYISVEYSDTKKTSEGLKRDTFYSKPSDINKINSYTINIYPNPAKDKLHFSSLHHLPFHFKFYNSIGAEVYITPINDGITVFDVSSLLPGIYFVQVSYDDFKEVRKLVIER
jgi:hypothetical protein